MIFVQSWCAAGVCWSCVWWFTWVKWYSCTFWWLKIKCLSSFEKFQTDIVLHCSGFHLLFEKIHIDIIFDGLENFLGCITVSRNYVLTISWFGRKNFSISWLFREISCCDFPGSTEKISRCWQCFEKTHYEFIHDYSKKFLMFDSWYEKCYISALILLLVCDKLFCWCIFTISEPGLIVWG